MSPDSPSPPPGTSDLLGGPAATYLPDDPSLLELADPFADPAEVAARFPASSAAWAALADQAYGSGQVIASYAYARTGYHRGLDALRRAGWKGHGPVPWSHEPNQGWLRSLHALGRAAAAIGEADEVQRCAALLADASPEAAATLTS